MGRTLTPARGLVLVRPVQTPETLPHGRIVLTETTRDTLTAGQMEVVAIGAPSICEDADCERPHQAETPGIAPHWHRFGWEDAKGYFLRVQAGDWVLIRHRSLLPTHQTGLFCCAQDDVLAVLQAG